MFELYVIKKSQSDKYFDGYDTWVTDIKAAAFYPSGDTAKINVDAKGWDVKILKIECKIVS